MVSSPSGLLQTSQAGMNMYAEDCHSLGKQNLFTAALTVDDYNDIVTQLFPQFGIVNFFSLTKKYSGIKGWQYTVWEQGHKYGIHTVKDNAGVAAVVLNPDNTLSITMNENVSYFLVTDVIKGINDRHYIVTDITFVGGEVVYKVQPVNNEAAVIGDFALSGGGGNGRISMLYNLQKECFKAPERRDFKYDSRTYKLATIASTAKVCDRAEAQRLKVMRYKGNEYVYYQHQQDAMEDVYRAMELYHLTGQAGSESSSGIIEQIMLYGNVFSYSTPLLEADVQGAMCHISELCSLSSYYGIAGHQFMCDLSTNVASIYTDSISYGNFSTNDFHFGLNLKKYSLGGTTVSFHRESIFSDPHTFPQNQGGMNWKSVCILTNPEHIKLYYKLDSAGESMKFNVFYGSGHAPSPQARKAGNNVGLDHACLQTIYSSYISQLVERPNCHGIMLPM